MEAAMLGVIEGRTPWYIKLKNPRPQLLADFKRTTCLFETNRSLHGKADASGGSRFSLMAGEAS